MWAVVGAIVVRAIISAASGEKERKKERKSNVVLWKIGKDYSLLFEEMFSDYSLSFRICLDGGQNQFFPLS